jgi:anti-sigma-K factor RskA
MSRDPRLDELLGAYELDALDADERAEVAAYLERSPEARREADRLGAAIAAMAAASTDDVPVPHGLWDRIRDAMHDEADTELPPLRLPPPLPAPRPAEAEADEAEADEAEADEAGPVAPVVALPPKRRSIWPKVAALAAAVVLALGIGVTVGRTMGDNGSGEVSLEQLAAAALADGGARVATLAGEGTPGVRAVVDPAGRGYLLADDLPSLPAGRTYQLWGVDGEAPVSLAVLGPDPGVVAFPAGAQTTTLAITDEAAPGASAPSAAPLVVGRLS